MQKQEREFCNCHNLRVHYLSPCFFSFYPDFCKKISIKYPSSPINTGPGGFAILSYFHGVFSFGMKKVKFFWSYYGGSIPCSTCLYDIYLGSVVKNRPLVLCILDNGTKIDKLLIKQKLDKLNDQTKKDDVVTFDIVNIG